MLPVHNYFRFFQSTSGPTPYYHRPKVKYLYAFLQDLTIVCALPTPFSGTFRYFARYRSSVAAKTTFGCSFVHPLRILTRCFTLVRIFPAFRVISYTLISISGFTFYFRFDTEAESGTPDDGVLQRLVNVAL